MKSRSKLFQTRVPLRVAVAVIILVFFLILTGMMSLPVYPKIPARTTCKFQLINLNMAANYYQMKYELEVGDRIEWGKLIGEGEDSCFENTPVCPSGGIIHLSPTLPEPGNTAATCSHKEHQFKPEELGLK